MRRTIGLFALVSIFTLNQSIGQVKEHPFVKLVEPTKEKSNVRTARQLLVGSTCKNCVLTVNGKPVKVYSTGGFAYELNLKPGDTNFTLNAAISSSVGVSKTVSYSYILPEPPDVSFL